MFYLENDFGLYYGKLYDNKFHKHYAIQICVSLKKNIDIIFQDNIIKSDDFFIIKSNTIHKLLNNDDFQLIILVNPISLLGYYLNLNNNYLINTLVLGLKNDIEELKNNEISFNIFSKNVSQKLKKLISDSEKTYFDEDQRILRAIEYMNKNHEVFLSLEQVSNYCNLSQSRFLHLFKEKTNINFRRYQLWNKVVKSLPFLIQNSVFDTAIAFGFFDSSHYVRAFKETFGMTPKFFNKNNTSKYF